MVSAIGFGSVELGMDYGIESEKEYGKPDKTTAKRIIHKAIDCGINLFDTAPSYGDSEELLGSVIGSKPCYIATKVNIPVKGENVSKSIRTSVETSLENLKRDYLDIVQIHNATVDTVNQSDIPETLLDLCKEGLLSFTGATVYKPENALAVINAGCFDVLQVAYNILDQRMTENVIPKAKEQAIGILGRSAYFKGVLTAKVQHLNQKCSFLQDAASKVKTAMNLSDWDELAELALAFCLSTVGIDSVLVGIRTIEELDFAVKVENPTFLPKEIYDKLTKLCIEDEYWLNPSNWPI